MTRKRFIKKLMAKGFSRNRAASIAKSLGKGSYEELYAAIWTARLSITISCSTKKMTKAIRRLSRTMGELGVTVSSLGAAMAELGRTARDGETE